ncbi:D-beta-hydroxybutyrate dehydrogenase [Candidatus Terasakiella magnetica]|uniref:D-beta-hydroxybutyrate dehydrogenase n=1 Tax=Candidatus Terasakiella magnetica TaxID=1867952 RepID=A0A1C3RJJ0_9PROT|nr:3-hydroxybutyrate dehydrogenase [Candidatus Terasakiella magnetica]SCA57421.1 D-beta-hydroxybutyrate dehydrogenase [Candidatus Terasakiella magnetica]
MLSGKTAIVTGSTSGIGLGIATSLCEQNCNVVINGRKQTEQTDKICADLDKLGSGKVLFQAADLSKLDHIETMMSNTKQEFGSVDIVVNNAGMQHVSPIEDFDPEKWDLLLSLNLSAAFHVMRLALPDMKAKNWGRVINVSSAHGQVASVNKSAYVASKHGLIGLTKVCALETAETGITANTICPGWVRTPLVEDQIVMRADKSGRTVEEEAKDLLSEKQPSKEFVTPKQLGDTAVYLCSDAASQMTGTTLTLDGGWTAQ